MGFVEEQALGAERVDRKWEEEHAKERREAWLENRRQLARERRSRREASPLPKRLYDVMVGIATSPSIKAGPIASQAKSATDGTSAPTFTDPAAIGHLHRDDIARHLRVIRHAVTALEEALDSERGFGHSADIASMVTEEKDKMILTDYVGLTPEDVARLQPALGDPRVIRRVRMEAGRDPQTGRRA